MDDLTEEELRQIVSGGIVRAGSGYMYQPQFESVQMGQGEEGGRYEPGELQSIFKYKEGQTAPGQAYEILDPKTKKVTGTGAFQKPGNAWELLKEMAVDLGPILQFTPLAPFVQAINAGAAIQSGNVAQGIGSLAGLGGYTDIANAAKFVGAAQSKDPLAILSAGMDFTGATNVGGFTTKDITAANAVVQGLQSGNVAQALSGAGQLTGSQNITTAANAAAFVKAVESGNPAAIFKAGESLTGAINAAKVTDTGDETARLQTRHGTANPLADLGLTTAVGAEDLTTQDLVDIVNPPGQVTEQNATAATEPIATGPTTTSTVTAEKTTATTDSKTSASGLPAFNNAAIRTLPQSRAAEIIAEMYPGKSLDWVDQGLLNQAASHIRAGDEAGLRARLVAGQALGTGDAVFGDVAVDWKPPAGFRIAQPGEVGSSIGYTETGTPVNLVQQLGTTSKRMTPEEAIAYDRAQAEKDSDQVINPFTGEPYVVEGDKISQDIADVARGVVSSAAGGVGEQINLLGVAGGWVTGNKDNAWTQVGSNIQSWSNKITPDSVKKGQDEISKDISEADGLPAKAWAAVKGAATNPLATLHWIGKEAIQEVLPLGSAITVGRTVSKATKLKFGDDLAQRYGLTAAIGTDATMNAGESATASYQEVYNQLRNKGVSVEDASSAASAAAAGSGLVTLFTSAIGDAALVNKLMNNVKGATLNATLKEGPTEFAEGTLQSVAEQNAINVALGKGLVFDKNQALTSGTLEALIGSGTTGVIAKSADIFTPTDTADTSTAPKTATKNKTEPTFDSKTAVVTDAKTGSDVTLNNVTGSSAISTADTQTRIDPTLEALGGTEIDTQQIIDDYITEVLGGTPTTGPATSVDSTGRVETTFDPNMVVGTDANTGANVTLGDLGLAGDATNTPTAAATTAAATTAAATTAAATTAPALTTSGSNANVVVGTDANTGANVTLGDLGLSSKTTAATTGKTVDTTSPVTAATTDKTAAKTDVTAPITNVSATTNAAQTGTTFANTGTVLSVDPIENTALVVTSSGDTSVINTDGQVKVGDKITGLGKDSALSSTDQDTMLSSIAEDTIKGVLGDDTVTVRNGKEIIGPSGVKEDKNFYIKDEVKDEIKSGNVVRNGKDKTTKVGVTKDPTKTTTAKTGMSTDELMRLLLAMQGQRPEQEEDYKLFYAEPLGYELMYGVRG